MTAPNARDVATRGALLLALAVGLLLLREGVLQRLVGNLGAPHKFFKVIVEVWALWLLHHAKLPWVIAGGATLGGLLAVLRGRAWLAVAACVPVGLAVALTPRQLVGVGPIVALALLGVAPIAALESRRRALVLFSRVPGAEFVGPAAVLHAVAPSAPRWARPLAAAVGSAALSAVAFGLGVAALYEMETHHPDFARWPDHMVDPRVEVLDRSEKIVGEHHSVQIVGGRAWITAEGSGRLLSVPLPSGPIVQTVVPPRRMQMGAVGSVSSWTDATTGLTWIMTGFNQLGGYVLQGDALVQVRRLGLQHPMNFPYLRWAEGRDQLLLVEIDAQNRSPGRITTVDVRGTGTARHCWLKNAKGEAFGSPRDAVWVPTIDRLVISPDYHRWLFTVDPATCLVEPWIDTGGFHGRLSWVPEWGRLLVSTPGTDEVPVLDPTGPTIERRIPTQPGVRTLAVDAGRDLLVTASLSTGAVEVRNATTGGVVDTFGTVMPMVREIALSPETGQAILSTWTVLYRIPYATSRD